MSVCLVGEETVSFFSSLLFGLLQLLDVMAEFECRAQLQPHVLHNDITAQQQQSLAVNLVFPEQIDMWAESLGISLLDKSYDVIDSPGRSVVP